MGLVIATPGALAALKESSESPFSFFERHVTGDWGEVDPEIKNANLLALVTGERLFSSFATAKGTKLLVVTEGDRASTCLLLPEEY